MTEFKAGDEIQFDANAVREADRIDKEQYGGTRGYAEGIIRKGGLESGGVIERNDYSDEAPFQIKLPNGSKCWAEEEWLKAPDKFQPGDKVDWIKADKYWRGVEVFERKDYILWGSDDSAEKIEGYRVLGPLPGGTTPGLIAASELVLHQEDDYDDWKANDSAEYYHSGDDSADSPDEAPVFHDYAPMVDEVQDDGVFAALGLAPNPAPGKFFILHTPPKDPDAPTAEELSKGEDISAHITDISGFSTTFTLGTWEEPEAVDHPAHYGGEDDPYEAIKVIEAWDLGFHLGNATKYIARAGKKDPETEIQDLEKARWYIDRKIELLKEGHGE